MGCTLRRSESAAPAVYKSGNISESEPAHSAYERRQWRTAVGNLCARACADLQEESHRSRATFARVAPTAATAKQ